MFYSNTSGNRIYTSKISRVSEYSALIEALYQWLTIVCSKNIYPGERVELTEKAIQIGEHLGKTDFKGSRG